MAFDAASFRRLRGLIRKEALQAIRDPSSIAIGVVMPVMLILLFGYALSLDVSRVPIALVLDDTSPAASEIAAGFQLSPYFEPHVLTSMAEAEQAMRDWQVDGIVHIGPTFTRDLALGDATVQLVVHGTNASRARIIEGYSAAAVAQASAREAAEGEAVTGGPVLVQSRLWFNEANDSHYFLVPGLIVMIMTIIGAMLTTFIMAREWERGTLEALFVSPVRIWEVLLGKIVPYFLFGVVGLCLCLLSARFLFDVPFRGSLWVLALVSSLYLLVALSIGLLISSAVKTQFLAIQLTQLVTMLPAMMLSGFIFDLRSMPPVVQAISYMLPARYYVSFLQTIFLAGDLWGVILPNTAVLAGMAAVLLYLAHRVTRKQVA